MREQYVREFILRDKSEQEKEEEIINNIIKLKQAIKAANKNFECVQDEELVDYYIYQLKAYQSKLNYLIKIAKNSGIEVTRIHKLKIEFNSNESQAI